MTFTTFFALALLLTVIPFTRLFGVIGLMLLIYAFPFLTSGVLLLLGIAFYFIYWRKSHV